MNITEIPTEPNPTAALAALQELLAGLGDLTTPPEADLTPVLETGGVPGVWVTADGPASAERGVVLYVHGGGFEHRMPELMNRVAHRYSGATGRPVFAAHYRLAPDHPYPEPVDDVVTVYRALLDQGVPAERITVLCESAGGTLALSALLVLKDAGVAMPAAVVGHSILTDLSLASPSIDTNTAGDLGVNREMLTHLVGQYLGGAPGDQAPQSPIHGELSGLPPLLLTVGTAEAIRDDTLRLAEAVSAAGGKVAVDLYEGMPHVFQAVVLDPRNPNGRTLLDRSADWLTVR